MATTPPNYMTSGETSSPPEYSSGPGSTAAASSSGSALGSPRSSDGATNLPRTIADAVAINIPHLMLRSGSSSGACADDSSEGYESEAGDSTARLLRNGSTTDAAYLSSRLQSRSSSPAPTVHHYHHHYVHNSTDDSTSVRRPGASTPRRTSYTDLKEAGSTSDPDYAVPDQYQGRQHRASALAKKLGFTAIAQADHEAPPAYYREKRKKDGNWMGKPRRKNSNREGMHYPYHRVANGGAPLPTHHERQRDRSCCPAFCPSCLHGVCGAFLRHPLVPTQPLTILFSLVLLASFAFSLTTFLIYVLDTDKEMLPWRTYCQQQQPFPHELADSLAPVDVFVGVFSVDAAYERRQLIRSTYARHTRPIDTATGTPSHNVQLKFVIGRPRATHARRVALEMELYNDLVVLDIKENMNRGKTHAFFSWAYENATVPVYYTNPSAPDQVGVGFKRADYVVKADDDAFIVLSELERHLRVTPREKTYWGYIVTNAYMAGETYALSADLVEYIATSEPVLGHLNGAEDKKTARWMRIHPNASSINWLTERCWIYDHPKAGTTYSHGFLFPDEVERIRLEGRQGLSDAEIARRGGPEGVNIYSTVSKFKEPYTVPAEGLTMEEEVEALIEGGGRYRADDDWRAPEPAAVDWDTIRFEAEDVRIQDRIQDEAAKLAIAGSLRRPSSDLVGSAGYRKLASDLYANLPEPKLVRRQYLDGLSFSGEPIPATDEHLAMPTPQPAPIEPDNTGLPMPKQHHAQLPVPPDGATAPAPRKQLVPLPSMRYDAEAMELRQRRMLGRPHGGTVVVHYLKYSSHFLETAIALLGRHRVWDSGFSAPAYAPVQPARAPVATNDDFSSVSTAPVWDGTGVVELVDGRWGSARMFGSPIVREDGYISEGRPVKQPERKLIRPDPAAAGSSRFMSGPGYLYADPPDGPNFNLTLTESATSTPVEPASSTSSATLATSTSLSSASVVVVEPSSTSSIPNESASTPSSA